MTTTITTVQIVTTLVGIIAPIIVGLITKASTSGQVKAILLLTVSVLAGIGQGFLDNPPGTVWDWQQAVYLAVVTWIIGVATYFGVLRPENGEGKSLNDRLQATLVKDDVALAA